MPAFTYQEIDFQITVREGFYCYHQPVSPAYLICGTGIEWAALVVHRLPDAKRLPWGEVIHHTPRALHDRWFVSERTTGGRIEIPETTSRDEAAASAVEKIKALGQDGFQKALERTQTQKDQKWHMPKVKEQTWHNR